jgi:phosphatidylserine/phosphatidylglycerophosphate/cardiolipin synthase-like enzyme
MFGWIWSLVAIGAGGTGYLTSEQIQWLVWGAKQVQKEVAVLQGELGGGTASDNQNDQPVRVYFTKPENNGPAAGDPASMLCGYIDAAQQTIDVCCFELDNKVITAALTKAVQRGVKVRLVTETDYIGESGVLALRAVNVPVVDDQRPSALMHNKFMVFDGKAVWTGSMNFTENCAYRNNNNGIYIQNSRLADNYSTKFKWMFEQRKFGGAPLFGQIPNPTVQVKGDFPIENYFSTHDKGASHVVDTVKKATKSMLDKSRAGVHVAGVFEKSQTASGHTEYQRMKEAGLPVFLDANPRNMHHKVIIVDGEVVVAGSFNFSNNADRTNDENMVIMHNADIASKFEGEFQKVAGLAGYAPPGGAPAAPKPESGFPFNLTSFPKIPGSK